MKNKIITKLADYRCALRLAKAGLKGQRIETVGDGEYRIIINKK